MKTQLGTLQVSEIGAGTKLDPKTNLRSGFDRFSPANIAANMPIVDLPTRFAATKNATPAQIALPWLLAQKPFIVSIPDANMPIGILGVRDEIRTGDSVPAGRVQVRDAPK